jgi:hypothetical protein
MQIGRVGGYSAYQPAKPQRVAPTLTRKPTVSERLNELIENHDEYRPPSPDISPGTPPEAEEPRLRLSRVSFNANPQITEFRPDDPPLAVNQQKYVEYLADQLAQSQKLIEQLKREAAKAKPLPRVQVVGQPRAIVQTPKTVQAAKPIQKPRDYYFPTIAPSIRKTSGWKKMAKIGVVGAVIGFGVMVVNPFAGMAVVLTCGAIAAVCGMMHKNTTVPCSYQLQTG